MTGQNSNIKNIKKLHNPKSYAPAVYIPCWLIQISNQYISHLSKLVYGRLSQWSQSDGTVYRSCPQLAKELGSNRSSIERSLKELRDLGLIGTFQPQAGGLNHFVFYDHQWMYAPIVKELSYDNSVDNFVDPTPEVTVPHPRSDGTPPSEVTAINIKEIKEIKKDIYEDDFSVDKKQNQYSDQFLEFWETTNKKGSKYNAAKAWRSLKLDTRLDELKELWNTYYLNDFRNREQQFRPNVSTWLNSHPWDNDKIPTLPATQNTSKTQNKGPRNDYRTTSDTEKAYEEKKRADALKDAQAFRVISEAVAKPALTKEENLQRIREVKAILGL